MTIILTDNGYESNTKNYGNVVDLFDTVAEFVEFLRNELTEMQSGMRADGVLGEDEFLLPSKRYPTHPKVFFKELWETYQEIKGEEIDFQII